VKGEGVRVQCLGVSVYRFGIGDESLNNDERSNLI